MRMSPRRTGALGPALALLVLVGGAIRAAAQKPPPLPPGAVEALMHCAPWRPDYTPDPAIPPPAEVRAVREGDAVRLAWRDDAGAETCFGVLRVLPPPVGPSSVEQVTLLVVTLANATETSVISPAAERACFAVYAGNAGGRSAPSGLACPDALAAPSSSPPRLSDALLAPNRERLAVCVDGVREAASAAPAARERVERALAIVARHRSFRRAGLDAVPPLVDEGCPRSPYLLEPGVFWEDGIPNTGAGRTVQEASIYGLFIFLLSPEDVARVIHGRLDVRITAEEMLCAGHQCGQVTTGLYLTPHEVADEPFLVEWLTKGLGLEPARPLVTPPDAPRGR